VALTMNLGMAEDVIDTDPTGAKALLTEARASARAALSELRDLVGGIPPRAVGLDVRLDRRLSAPVYSAGYFVVAESLANAVRHSGAHRIQVSVVDAGSALRITVRDDGLGGADPSRGTGLRGIQRRLSAFDGTLRIASPPGGPTVLEMKLPCAS